MKHIIKAVEPADFTAWKAANPGATYRHDLCNNHDRAAVSAKRILKQALLAEQHYLCCYCECRISAADSHIEHFKPKGVAAYAHLQLDYSNLHASCTLQPTGSVDEHCGHKKGNSFSPDLVSPLEPDCSSHFTYTLNGHIGHTDKRGKETISMLSLDSALLNRQRKLLIDTFTGFDEAELPDEIAIHLDTSQPAHGEFFTMIEYLSANHLL